MKAMIVAPQPVAVEAGFEVLRGGGNAVDAAVTCALVQGVVSPHMCGVGGYAVVTLSPGGGAPVFLDGPALAGSLVTPEMWQERLLRPSPNGWSYFLKGRVNDIGYTSVCTPGAVKLLATLLERYGTLDWEQHRQSGWLRRGLRSVNSWLPVGKRGVPSPKPPPCSSGS